ncbi:inorganic phosphate transporter [Kribbella pittospori]|uniref:Inorganic phosphate transporter n=1 Tax=Kribbella pittospori TaxID=722689 RepID=A0A4R0KWY7_9ACTN|nr:inorganic phosphate transporter [Kribbella pittospori]
MDLSFLVVVVIVTALVFDFTNGFHDTANAMATSIATGALRPKIAVAISAVLNLVGAFISTEVAKTISSGLVDDTKITVPVIFGGLVGAILWNLLTWYLGLPSSSSHALFGGLIGATWIAAGSSAVHFGTVVQKVIVPAVAAPIVAGVVALLGTFLAYKITQRARQKSVEDGFRAGQIASASLVSLAHGTGDAQKTMGVITLVLITSGSLAQGSGPPVWVILSAGLAIAAITLPAAAVVGALSGRVADSGNLGVVIIALLAIVAGGGIYLASRRRPVTSDNVNKYPTTPATTAAAA